MTTETMTKAATLATANINKRNDVVVMAVSKIQRPPAFAEL
eukprot:CAMPEP_0194754544 /NCGR_PEP_ID=MMETSP0323_2-20130528/8497_1 /TAXON_ID=2866 ORGANISM="Crypthecodinium cohnii, Strain Seligo" /NCGR_SAMPLE_ID=MMETSP0323_2 /ASSEMBLY_ACC=CAM_ASM_000346 /LENGTH=40 /DNA_ID= /DNA_START= /DNA_END= /DNA_ORIENTATION=